VPLPLDPGKQELIVTAPGRSEARFTVVLEEGKTAQIEVMPGAKAAAASRPGPLASVAAPAPLPRASESSGNRTLGYVLAGVGVAALAGGTVAGILTLDAKSTNKEHCSSALRTCDPQGRDAAEDGRLYGTLTTAGLIVGLAGVGLGTYFIVTSGSKTALTAQGGPAGGSVTVLQRW
jgi:hypothetical protein